MSLSTSVSVYLTHARKRSSRTGSYSSPEAVTFKETESKAVRSLAAYIPPELFENILFYVNVNRVSQRKYGNGILKRYYRERLHPDDILINLKQCSLVCLFWANKCREYMFSARILEIRSYEDAKIFRRYVVGGCPRLTPVQQLISKLDVTQNYIERSSFLDLLYLPAIQDKLDALHINGPVPPGFNSAKLDTPHWGIPTCIVVPNSFMRHIVLKHVHFPSFRHVTKYMRHFTCATYIHFEGIRWHGQTPTYSLPQASNTIPCQRRPRSLTVLAVRFCTDPVHLALTALMLNPNCPLHRLSDEERMWMTKFMTLLYMWGHKKDPYVPIGFNILEQATTMRLEPFCFVFEGTPSTDRSASSLSVVGMHAYIEGSYYLPAADNFDALVNHARTQPTIRALVLLFDSSDRLQEFVKRFVEVLALTTETIDLVLAYEKEEERKAVGVDLVTLEPNGRINTWDDEQSEYYWGQGMSLQLLQGQLKKRWMSIH
ncbi:hypothetical protein BC629DRAFT_1737939 [Irpex lacteus]|nr:hypothetical protein BC629DRAFT_1737939 [Irpex lacteus]